MNYKSIPFEEQLPPLAVHFLELEAQPQPDGRRILTRAVISPFQQPPNLILTIQDATGNEVSRIIFIENQDTEISFMMHIRSSAGAGRYRLTANVSYPEIGDFNPAAIEFEVP